jgi:CheY-like chemotaxis protein
MAELKKIMHVDDDEDIRSLTKISLETIGGFQIAQCASGRAAIEAAPGFLPDLFLLDSMMPEMSGEETFAAMRDIPDLAAIPVIFMTAKAQVSATEAMLALGALGVITKPFDPITLPDQLRHLWSTAS